MTANYGNELHTMVFVLFRMISKCIKIFKNIFNLFLDLKIQNEILKVFIFYVFIFLKY